VATCWNHRCREQFVHSWMVSALSAMVFSAVQKVQMSALLFIRFFSCRKQGHLYHLSIVCCIALPVSIHHPSSSSWWALYQLMPLLTRAGKYFPFPFSLETIFTIFFFTYITCVMIMKQPYASCSRKRAVFSS